MDIAIVGLAFTLPGGIRSRRELWRLLERGESAVGELPPGRWKWPSDVDPVEGHPGIDHGGFLVDAAEFDAEFFRVAPRDAELMDPQQRISLELAWACLEDAGYAAATLAGSNTGVFMGVSGSDYRFLTYADGRAIGPKDCLNTAVSLIPNRISHCLDLNGPSIQIDTACSSSLVAVHEAMQCLRSGRCDGALAGAVHVMCHPGTTVSYYKAGMLARDGRCKTFAASADGFVRSEGAALLYLKRLEDALRDGDHVHALLKGSAVNHGGMAGGVTVPNARVQGELIATALHDARLDAGSISYVEAHGSGTALGDPLEFEGLCNGFLGAPTSACGLGSVKTNLGHLEAAAGMAGLLKVLLSLERGALPASINCAVVNQKIRFEGSPFHLVDELRPWTVREGQPRRAGVNSFGWGGTNSHVIVEEYLAEPGSTPLRDLPGPPWAFVLSARDEQQLSRYAVTLLEWLDTAPTTLTDLASVAYTLQVGREAMRQRLAIRASSVDELASGLRSHLGEGSAPVAVSAAQVGGPIDELVERWLAGATVNWQQLYAGGDRPQRVPLPTYPFARDRYWLQASPTPLSGAGVAGVRSTVAWERVWVTQPPIRAVAGLAGGMKGLVLLAPRFASSRATLSALRPDLDCQVLLESDFADGGERVQAFGMQLFEQVRRLLLQPLAEPVMVQVVLDHEELEFALSGLLKSARQENPLLVGQVIGLDAAAASGLDLQRMLEENASEIDAVEIRYVDGERQVARWVGQAEVIAAPRSREHLPWRGDGVYWITGGAGGLGRLFAREILACARDARVILTGRSELDGRSLSSLGGAVEYRVLDVTDAAAVEQFVAQTVARFGAINGVIHAAAVSHDGFAIRKSPEDFSAVLAPKVRGTVNVDRATASLPLDFFLLCSSMMGALGNIGQTDYALANEFQAHFATWRSVRVGYGTRRGRTLSVAWPMWEEGGMCVDSATSAWWAARGFHELPTDSAFAALGHAFNRAATGAGAQMLVLHGVSSKLESALRGGIAPPTAARVVSPSVPTLLPEALRAATLDRLKEVVSQITRWDVRKIDPTEHFAAYGIDSIGIMEANAKLSPHFPGLPKTLFFEHANLAGVCSYLLERYADRCASWTGSVGPESALIGRGTVGQEGSTQHRPVISRAARRPKGDRESVAIVGLAGHYPQAHTLEEFWSNLKLGRDCIREIPPERWTLEDFYEPSMEEAFGRRRSYAKWGGFLERYTEFDAAFFDISPRDALGMDPQERLFLQTCWEAMEDAGYTREWLARRCGGRVGVFAGVTKTGFELYRSADQGGRNIFPRTSFSSVANRVSHWLNLNGPSMPVDTMCSASLTAVHLACEHLLRGDCELAVAGGVNLYLHPSTYVDLCGMRMLAADGKCRSFGKDATGFVPGEGVGVVWLKRLSEAMTDGEHIHAVIRGTSINHGGRTNGYTVPSPSAQRDLIRAALARAGVEARELSCVEAHGTGTALGDPIEISGLTQAFAGVEAGGCAIGSVKSNIGHLEAAAGIAGLTKVVLQMRHQMLVPTLHAREPNPHIDFSNTPFVVQQELTAWQRSPRIAGVAAFGAGGANAYAILEEYVEQPSETVVPVAYVADQPSLILLSAKTTDGLQRQGQQLLATIERGFLREKDLRATAYTLQVGREAMEHRLALSVMSMTQLKEKLHAALAGELPDSNCHSGYVARNDSVLVALNQDEDLRAAVSSWLEKGKLTRLAELWVRGLEVDWRRLYGADAPRMLSLPAYPFARERHWHVTAGERVLGTRADSGAGGAAVERPARPMQCREAEEMELRSAPSPGPQVAAGPILERVLGSLRVALYLEHESVDVDQPFAQLGLDSVIGVEWLSQLNREFGLSLSATRLYEYPTVRGLSELIGRELRSAAVRPEPAAKDAPSMPPVQLKALTGSLAGGVPPAASASEGAERGAAASLTLASLTPESRSEPIAIIGMSGRYPLAPDLQQFWHNLSGGRDCVREIPPGRFAVSEHDAERGERAGQIYCPWLGSLDEIDCFDPQFFHISPAEAAGMDPQHRLMLQESYRAFEDAGYSPQRLSESSCGVYLGIMGSEYAYELIRHASPSMDTTGTSAAIAAGRIAYYLNLKGPALAIDTACSSSLVALHLGCQGLRSGEIGMALVGGVSLYLSAHSYVGMCAAGMLSRAGRCKSFDNEADGFVPGEGVGALVLKRLRDAQADGDRILGVIIGSGINQDGKTNGMTAPSVSAQRELLREVYGRYGIDPDSIGYVEAHGTGTKLGDPVEVQALREVYGEGRDRGERCGLGSVKSNIGHASAAAGVAGVHKVLLCLQHRQWVPSLHYRCANEHLDLERSPFRVITECAPWPQRNGQPRRGAISSFGYSGTNAHVVVEEYVQPRRLSPPGAALVVLSGRTETALRQQVQRLAEYLQIHGPVDLRALAYTLQVGRQGLAHRAGFVTHSVADLQQQLQGHLGGTAVAAHRSGATPSPLGTQRPDPGDPVAPAANEACERTEWLQHLRQRWLQGEQPDWSALYDDQPTRLSLPTYPFEKVRCWMVRPPPATGRSVLLTKQWQADPAALSRPLPQHVAILTTAETLDLAHGLASRFPNCDLLGASQLDTERRLRSYDAWIDLVGCGETINHTLTWIPALQEWLDRVRSVGAVALQVTRGLEALESDTINLSGADRVGLYRMLSSEYAHVRSRHLDVERQESDAVLIERIVDELRAEDAEVEICYRRGIRHRAVLAEAGQTASRPADVAQHCGAIVPDAVLLITGGTRGIGSLCARHFTRTRGVKRLLLTGKESLPPREDWDRIETRDAPMAARIATIRALEADGVQVRTSSVDLADKHALRALVLETAGTMGPIAGIVHCAGAFDARNLALIGKSMVDVRRIVAPKMEGLDNLLECTADQPLQFALLYSSVSAAVPRLACGQGEYAMANAYMDYVALSRSARSAFPIISIQWPNWRDTGFGATSSEIYHRLGFTSHSDSAGLQLLDGLLSIRPAAVVLPAVVDPERFTTDNLLSARSDRMAPRTGLAGPTELPQLEAWLQGIITAELKVSPAEVDVNVSLQHYGADSVLLAQALRRIGEGVGETLDPAVLYEYPTIRSFAQWLARTRHVASEPRPQRIVQNSKADESDIAVVGLSCRFPGCADPEGFWEMLSSGRSAIAPIPAGRWGHEAGFHAAFLENGTQFDPEFFHIDPDEARAMDPQALVLLEESLNLWCRSGYSLTELEGQPIGVYLGARATTLNPLATYVSRFFDLRGPSVVLDSACSSSLVAMNLAIQALRCGEIDSALVGGVSLLETDAAFKQFARRGILSRQPQLHLFDRRAEGSILGEGVGLVWLKTVGRALRDGDPIQAIIKAVAVNNDGRTAGAAPNFAAQQALMQTALRRSGHQASEVCSVEVSGSGSELNDLLELKAIRAVYRDTSASPCELGSCKPNIGHLLTAAAIASFIKAALMLRHRSTVPFLSAHEPMAHFDFRASRLGFSRRAVAWDVACPVMAVNSFADGGTNAHAILRAWDEARAPSQLRQPLTTPVLTRRSLKQDPLRTPTLAFWERAG